MDSIGVHVNQPRAPGKPRRDFHYINELAISPNGSTLLAATRTGIFRSS